jgi:hypothetical protein
MVSENVDSFDNYSDGERGWQVAALAELSFNAESRRARETLA